MIFNEARIDLDLTRFKYQQIFLTVQIKVQLAFAKLNLFKSLFTS